MMILFGAGFAGPFTQLLVWLVSDVVPLAIAIALAFWGAGGLAENAD